MVSKRRRRLKDLAIQRIKILYGLARDKAREGDYDLSKRYIELAIKIGHKARIRLPIYIRRGYCRRCKVALIPGVTARVRLQGEGKGSHVVVTCLICGWKRRYMIKTRRK